MSELSILSYFFIFFLGTIFGSFLNVIAFELEPVVFEKKTKTTFWQRINRRSQCPNCQHILQPHELVPLFSYIFLKGKCSSCKQKISSRYFLVEIFSGLVFSGLWYFLIEKYFSFLNTHLLIEFIYWIPVLSILILIFLFDFKHKIIPDRLLILLLPLAILYSIFDFNTQTFIWLNILQALEYAFGFAFPFFAIWFLSKGRAMGFADWKLIFVLTFFLNSFAQELLFVVGSFWVGAIYSLPLLILKKKYGLKSEVPFGPFIILSFLLTIFSGFSYYTLLTL